MPRYMYAYAYTHKVGILIAVVKTECTHLSVPVNARIASCSSGTAGMGYEGDTCSFTCNTGYELTGSDTRTCQSNGSWSGSDVVCREGNINYVQNSKLLLNLF